MSNRNSVFQGHLQAGVTLIELMISILLGLLLLSAATAMTVKTMVMNGDTLKSVKLNQDLDAVIQVMVNDIRRAGYTGGLFDFTDGEDLNIPSSSCILYAYDASDDGVLDDNEKYGFRLVNGRILMRTTCAAGASCATTCTAGTWLALTDPGKINISALTFDTLNSKCLSITDNDNVATGNENNYWETTTDGVTRFPCVTPTSSDVTTYVLDANDDYVSGTFVAPQSGDRLIEARQVNVQITGNLVNDTAMAKNQVVAINVRNNHIRVIP
jgi:type IV pilus assembly protein PilW